MRKPIFKILKEVDEKVNANERVACLQQYDSPVLRTVLKNTFDPKVEFALPEGPVPEEFIPKTDDGDDPTALYTEAKRLYIFIKGPNLPEITEWRRQKLFIDFLSYMLKEEREVVIGMKDKRLPYKNITADLVKKAFPELL